MRAFKSVGGNPIVFESVKGPYAFDVDGNKCASPMATALRIAYAHNIVAAACSDSYWSGCFDMLSNSPSTFLQGEKKTTTSGLLCVH